MMGHSICFKGVIWKIISKLSLLPLLFWRTVEPTNVMISSSIGPMLWYQQFEYAIGHWLQKATEHVFGCVLCAPGCFSLFRGSSLMDDNVARTYAMRATEAGHYIQYDQGNIINELSQTKLTFIR